MKCPFIKNSSVFENEIVYETYVIKFIKLFLNVNDIYIKDCNLLSLFKHCLNFVLKWSYCVLKQNEMINIISKKKINIFTFILVLFSIHIKDILGIFSIVASSLSS